MRIGGGLLAISPHCDDAVFACGSFLRNHLGSVVATIFAGRPDERGPLTEWDRAAGFLPGDDVMGIRRAEDEAALSLIDAHPLWFDFRDAQYGAPPSVADLVEALHETILRVDSAGILAPMGLFHSDHLLTHEAVVELIRRHSRKPWILYEDTFYRRIEGLVAARVARCEARGLNLRDLSPGDTGSESIKKQAVLCYRSQLRALSTPGRPGCDDAFAPESFWRVCL